MSAFLKALRSGRVLLMDGAMGTELQRAGIAEGECYEMWNLTHPEKVRAIHEAYVNAGAEVLLTHTFQANPDALARHGCLSRLPEIQAAAMKGALDVAGPDRFVLADIGPVERLDVLDLPAWLSAYSAAHGLFLETSSNFGLLQEIVAWQACSSLADRLPILVSFSFLRNTAGELQTHDRLSPEVVARQAAALGVAALGMNCGRDLSMEDAIAVIRRYRSATELPLFARANAGTPRRVGQAWEYPYTAQWMAERLDDLLEAGTAMVGGCCGTTPGHIAAFRPIVTAWNARRGHPPSGPFS
jgi:methionine synthase I (cobalamin-dependent)